MKNISEEQKERRNFPSIEEYELSEELSEKRLFLLEIIKKIEEIMNYDGDDTVVRESKIAELDEQKIDLENMAGKKGSLDQFLGKDGSFTEDSRHNPKIMVQWIAHDLSSIITKLSKLMTATGLHAQIREFDDSDEKSEHGMDIIGGGGLN